MAVKKTIHRKDAEGAKKTIIVSSFRAERSADPESRDAISTALSGLGQYRNKNPEYVCAHISSFFAPSASLR
jgi:hypothetical protein